MILISNATNLCSLNSYICYETKNVASCNVVLRRGFWKQGYGIKLKCNYEHRKKWSFDFCNGGSFNTSGSDLVCKWNVRFFGRGVFSWHSCGLWQRVLTYLKMAAFKYGPNVSHYLPNYMPSRTRRQWNRGSIPARVVRNFRFHRYIQPLFAAEPSYAPVATWIKRPELKGSTSFHLLPCLI